MLLTKASGVGERGIAQRRWFSAEFLSGLCEETSHSVPDDSMGIIRDLQ